MIAITIFLVIGVDVMRILVFRLLLFFPDRKTSDFVAKMLPIGFKSCVDFLLT